MGKAKTASKNNPTTREKAKEVLYKGKKVKPCLFIDEGRKFMAMQSEDGSLVEDKDGEPLPWSATEE